MKNNKDSAALSKEERELLEDQKAIDEMFPKMTGLQRAATLAYAQGTLGRVMTQERAAEECRAS